MLKKILVITAAIFVLAALAPTATQAFDMTGGPVWKARVGPGLGVGAGLNGCGDGVCRRDWGTRYSIGGVVGFHYRIIPNLVVFGEIHTGHVPVDYDDFDRIDRDNGFIFETTGGAEFHLPLTGWVAPYVGMGMGFVYLGAWVHTRDNDYHYRFTGFDFQFRTGADFFVFSKAPNISIGPQILVSTPAWINGCYDGPGDDFCDDPDDLFVNRRGSLPKLFYFGGIAKFWF